MPEVKSKEQRNTFGMARALQKDANKYDEFKERYGEEFADKLWKIAYGSSTSKPMGRNKLRAAASVDNDEIPKKVGTKADVNENIYNKKRHTMKKIMLFEEYLDNRYIMLNEELYNMSDDELNESMKRFFGKLNKFFNRVGLEFRIGFTILLLPLLATGVHERDLFKSDVRKLLKYFRQYIKQVDPEVARDMKLRQRGLALNVDDGWDPVAMRTFISFYDWLMGVDPEFVKEYMGGMLTAVYNNIKEKDRAFQKAVKKYKMRIVDPYAQFVEPDNF